MKFRLLALIVFCLTGPAAAQELSKVRPDIASSCTAGNALCVHLREIFGASLSRADTRREPVGLPIWRRKIQYITAGLTPDGDALFDDLLEGFAAKAGLQVERVSFERAASANLTFLVTSDVGEAVQGRRFGGLVGPAMSESRRQANGEKWRDGFSLIRLEHDRGHDRYEIGHCYAALHPEQLVDRPGLRMARLLYRCLVGGNRSDAIRPSLFNRELPAALDAPPYAKMAAVDRALLQLLYADGAAVSMGSPAHAVATLERELRQQGFDDNGNGR
ncbi:MAG: hypothetical protein JWM77_3628 [Rhodospirillales bacterium]|jgi:hypothetical protein|nr:hypothetical protein [Rhodospirillales bacterium]